jgi:RNA polymerase sigma-70 factor (ECF subfamily)
MSSSPAPASPDEFSPDLVPRLRRGDADAGRVLQRMFGTAIYRFCWGYLGNADDAEDATQEIFCKVLRASDVPDSFRAWLYRIARNHCLNMLRDRARRRAGQALPGEDHLPESLTGNLTRLLRSEQRKRVAQLLAELPAMYSEVLRLRYAEDLSRAEIAHVLGIPESIVKSRLCEGLKKLRSQSEPLPS